MFFQLNIPYGKFSKTNYSNKVQKRKCFLSLSLPPSSSLSFSPSLSLFLPLSLSPFNPRFLSSFSLSPPFPLYLSLDLIPSLSPPLSFSRSSSFSLPLSLSLDLSPSQSPFPLSLSLDLSSSFPNLFLSFFGLTKKIENRRGKRTTISQSSDSKVIDV